MSLGNNSSVSQARGKNVAIKVRKEKERIVARDAAAAREQEGGSEEGGSRGGR
tara:strand:- start:48 stop:206 length:159 start_codon:yes stop_codon:yes gene_type:complete